MKKITLAHQHGQCLIQISNNLIASNTITNYCASLANQIIIISDESIVPLYAEPLISQLKEKNKTVLLLTVPPGENYKSRETKALLEDKMLAQACGRDSLIIAVGGGVITDLSGFIGATYCRGIPTVYVPTTLLAMVDAAIGGKTGVNTPYGKNLIGCFYQPHAVFCDTSSLKTLPQAELNNGLAETIKHALIKDSELFAKLETIITQYPNCQLFPDSLFEDIIHQSILIKKNLVQQDETESSGPRQLLNFGHTIAHAIEKHLDYKIAHGQAVLIGIEIESDIAMQLNLLSPKYFIQIKTMIKKIINDQKFKLSPEDFPKILQHMRLDKKNKNNQPYFVLLTTIGKAQKQNNNFSFPVDLEIIKQAFNNWCHAK